MNLLLYGTSCSGKSTLMNVLTQFNYQAVPTGALARQLYNIGCQNMPVIIQTIISTLAHDRNYCFDHFYVHTCEQLHDLFNCWPTVIHLIDRRTVKTQHSQDPAKIERKQKRFDEQATFIEKWLSANSVPTITVYNTDYGFDLSELIEHSIVPYNTRVMIKPENPNANN